MYYIPTAAVHHIAIMIGDFVDGIVIHLMTIIIPK